MCCFNTRVFPILFNTRFFVWCSGLKLKFSDFGAFQRLSSTTQAALDLRADGWTLLLSRFQLMARMFEVPWVLENPTLGPQVLLGELSLAL